MPGVHGQLPMTSGIYSQPILVRGTGYTLLGLVGSDAEKEALKTCQNWDMLPMMSRSLGYRGVERTVVLEVDMVNRKAELYVPALTPTIAEGSPPLELVGSWENMPEEVWVAVAMKRNSQREAVLLPRTHWDVQEIGA
jgi:hypothetical protein